MNKHRTKSACGFAVGAAACMLLLLTVSAGAQQRDDGRGAAMPEPLGGQMQGMMPDVSGIQQQMQEQMMRQMSQQMQAASPAAQMQGAAKQAPAAGQMPGMPDVSGIQQQMMERMMGQMTQQMQAASPAAQMQGAAQPAAAPQMQTAPPAPSMPPQGSRSLPGDPTSMQQNLRFQMQSVLGLNSAMPPPQSVLPGGMPLSSAITSAAERIDPKAQASINEKMMKIMEETIQETLSGAGMQDAQRKMMAERLQGNLMPAAQAAKP